MKSHADTYNLSKEAPILTTRLSPGVIAGFDSHLRGPSFVMEPPTRLEFSNSSGGWLDCSASGSPQPSIDWLSVDGTSVGDVSGIRRVLRNGTLMLLPFAAAAYRQDIHSTVYRCVASNTVGRIISRDVQVRAGKLQSSTSTIKITITILIILYPSHECLILNIFPHRNIVYLFIFYS